MVAGSPRPHRGPRGLHGHRGAAAGHSALARQTPRRLPPPTGGRHSAGGSRVAVGLPPAACRHVSFVQDEPQILGTTNGTIGGRKLFQCHQNHGKFVPISDLVKEEDFFNIVTGRRSELESNRSY